MSRLSNLTIVLMLGSLLAACAGPGGKTANVAPLKTTETSLGTVLTDEKGYSLYTYKHDPMGKSDCSGRCARKWPPVMVNGELPAGSDLSVIDRKDGSRQIAYRGRPLYRWIKDKQPGQVTGHNLGEVWFVAKP